MGTVPSRSAVAAAFAAVGEERVSRSAFACPRRPWLTLLATVCAFFFGLSSSKTLPVHVDIFLWTLCPTSCPTVSNNPGNILIPVFSPISSPSFADATRTLGTCTSLNLLFEAQLTASLRGSRTTSCVLFGLANYGSLQGVSHMTAQ